MLANLRPVSRLHRTFFSAPSFSPFKTDLQHYSERKVLPYNSKELFDVVANVSLYPKFIPFCTECRVLSPSSNPRLENGVPYKMDVQLTAGFLSFEESYVSEVTCVPFKSVQAVAKSSTPLFTSLSTTWKFQPAPSSAHRPHSPSNEDTLVVFDLAYAFSNPIHAAVSSAFFSQVSKQMVNAFESRCAEVYGPRKR